MNQYERVLLVPGIASPQFVLKKWENYLKNNFPKIQVLVIEKFYHHLDIENLEHLANRVTNILKYEKPTLVIGHSFGGIIIRAAVERLEKTSHIKVVTLGSPHIMKRFGIERAKHALQVKEISPVPIISFGGYLDPVVPFRIAEYPQSKEHHNLWTDHWRFVFSEKVIKRVIENVN